MKPAVPRIVTPPAVVVAQDSVSEAQVEFVSGSGSPEMQTMDGAEEQSSKM
jgi:hypothetical protein